MAWRTRLRSRQFNVVLSTGGGVMKSLFKAVVKFIRDFIIALIAAIILCGMIMWISGKITIMITGQGL
jgi:hypothetical protein